MKQVNNKNKIEVTIKKEINVFDLLDKVEKLVKESKQRSLFVKMDYEIVDEIISCLKYIDGQKKEREESEIKSKKYCFGNYWVSIACMLCNMSSSCKQASKDKGAHNEKVN